MNNESFLALIKENTAKFIDLRFTDTYGKEQHITVPTTIIDHDFLQDGKTIDGSSIKGWKNIDESDLVLMPDIHTLQTEPFYQEPTLMLRCNLFDPVTNMPYARDPRSLAIRAENYLKNTGIADKILFGPELEFFIFDDVRWQNSINGCFYHVDSDEAQWNSDKIIEGGNIGHRPKIKGGYFPVPPVDSSQDIRSAMSIILQSLDIIIEAHHHEVATCNQCEIATKFDSLLKKADQVQMIKYVIHNVAHNYGKTATFMPKPLVGDNGNGMHCHISLSKNGSNLFIGNEYAGLSEIGLYFIGGIIKHTRALNAFTNPTINSYKRLIPGFEAPVFLTYSSCNRSAAIRIPYAANSQSKRIEVRFPDPMANPYLAFSALMMAGLDGIQQQIHPGEAIHKNLYTLHPSELINVPKVSQSLEQSLQYLQEDYKFLLHDDVFSMDFLNSYIQLRESEIHQFNTLVHPFEFELYYSS